MRVHGHGGGHKLHTGGKPGGESAPAGEAPAGGKHHGKHGQEGSAGADRLGSTAKADYGNQPWGDDDDATQAFPDSCVATSLQRELRAQDPQGYRQRMDQLAATGETTLANGTKLSLAPEVLSEIQGKHMSKQLERSALMQAAIMAYAKDQGFGADGGGIKEGDVPALAGQLGVNLSMAGGKLAVGQYIAISEHGAFHLVKVVGATQGKKNKVGRYTLADGSANQSVLKRKRVTKRTRATDQDGVGTLGGAATTVSGYRSRR